MSDLKQVRLSISLPAELATWARERAKAEGVSVSRFVADAIRYRRAVERGMAAVNDDTTNSASATDFTG